MCKVSNVSVKLLQSYGSAYFWSQKGSQYQKSHVQNPNFQLSLGFYLDIDKILKVWSPLGKRISLHKFWSQKGFKYQKGSMPWPKSKISTFIKFLPRYWPNPESLVTIGRTDLSQQILVPKRFPVPAGPKNQNWATKKKYHLGITLKIPETLEFNLGNVIRTRYAAPKFGPKKVSSTKKVLCHAQNPNFQLSLGFYLDTDQILKVWSP